MRVFWQAQSVRVKMTVVASGVAVLSAAVMVAAGLWELANFAGQARANLDQLMRTDLEHLTVGVQHDPGPG